MTLDDQESDRPWRDKIASLRAFGVGLLDVLMPPQCLACRSIIETAGLLCPSCFAKAQMIAPPMCRQCGVPLAAATGVSGIAHLDLTCGRCLSDPPLFSRARSVFTYDDIARQLVTDLKYRDRLEGRQSLGAWLARASADLAATADLIVPVPLHYRRLVRRRYNQAAVLARSLAERTGRQLAVDALIRQRPTKSQTGLSLDERTRNMRGAFVVRSKCRAAIKGAQILLVDDVLTTGATANACAKALLQADAREVTVVTLARTKEPV